MPTDDQYVSALDQIAANVQLNRQDRTLIDGAVARFRKLVEEDAARTAIAASKRQDIAAEAAKG